jgi:EmrB/QacA subfamily drug resistance transporter
MIAHMSELTTNRTDTSISGNAYRWLSLLVLALALAIIVIDGTVLNVSQTYAIKDLNTDLSTIQWAFTSYSLVLAALTIIGGRLGDMFGRKRLFILGALIFALGSAMTALSTNATMLIVGWSIIEGIGAAMMVPASSALLVSNFEGKERGIAFGIYGATAGAASSFGPILGGYFATTFSWRWAFGINVVIAALLCLGSIIVRDFPVDKTKKLYLDITGALLSSVGLVAIMFGIIESSKYGWIIAKKPLEIAGNTINLAGISVSFWAILLGLIFVTGFIFWERKVESQGKAPLITLNIFRNRQFAFGIGTLTSVFAGFSGLITYGIIFFLLTVRDLTPLEAGLALIPFSAATFVMAPLSGKLGNIYGEKIIVQIGLAINLLGGIFIYNTISPDASVNSFIPAFIVTGIGFGMIAAQLNNLILSSVPAREAGVASGINGTIREIGRAFGIALIGAAFISMLSTTAKANVQNNPLIPDTVKTSIQANLDSGTDSFTTTKSTSDQEILNEAKQRGINLPVVQAQQDYISQVRKIEETVSSSIKQAITTASKQSLLYTIGFSTLAFIVSFGLPNKRSTEKQQA